MPRKVPPAARKGALRATGLPRGHVFLQLPAAAGDTGLAPELREDDAPKGYTRYEDRYVLFIDILGFTELIHQSSKDDPPSHGSVSAIFQALDWQFDAVVDDDFLRTLDLTSQENDVLKVHTFSDFVVASCPATQVGLATILFIAFNISRQWLSMKYLSRGGIARGKVLHRIDEGAAPMVFGPAFVEAYKLESQVADLPRIVLSQTVRKECDGLAKQSGKLGQFVQKMVRRCPDGPNCIDVFSHLRKKGLELAKDHMAEAGQFQAALAHHMEEAADTPNWFRKADWLARRFNAAIQSTRYAHLHLDLQES